MSDHESPWLTCRAQFHDGAVVADTILVTGPRRLLDNPERRQRQPQLLPRPLDRLPASLREEYDQIEYGGLPVCRICLSRCAAEYFVVL